MPPKPVPKTDYARLQQEEIEALEAIYPGDFQEIKVKGPWSGSSERAFRLELKPLLNPDIQVHISVKFPATYPKTLPIISIDEARNVRQKSVESIRDLFKNIPKSMLGQQIITSLTAEAMETLMDEAEFQLAGETRPTLEEERAQNEAQAAKLAKDQEKRELETKDRLKVEADKAMQQKIDEEIARGRGLGRRKSADPAPSAQGTSSASSSLFLLFSAVS